MARAQQELTRHVAETEGFEIAPRATETGRNRVNPRVLTSRTCSSIRSAGFDSWQKRGGGNKPNCRRRKPARGLPGRNVSKWLSHPAVWPSGDLLGVAQRFGDGGICAQGLRQEKRGRRHPQGRVSVMQ